MAQLKVAIDSSRVVSLDSLTLDRRQIVRFSAPRRRSDNGDRYRFEHVARNMGVRSAFLDPRYQPIDLKSAVLRDRRLFGKLAARRDDGTTALTLWNLARSAPDFLIVSAR